MLTVKTLETLVGLDLEGLGLRSLGDPEAPTGQLRGIQGYSGREQLPQCCLSPRPRGEPRPSVCYGWSRLLSLLLAGWCRLSRLLGSG